MKRYFIFILLALSYVNNVTASPTIRLNYAGFYPRSAKVAVVLTANQEPFYLISMDRTDTVLTGKLGPAIASPYSGKVTRIVDFSSITTPGWYILCVHGHDCSYPFQIRRNILQPVANAAMKSFYFQRASAALPKQYAGEWARAKGHPDNKVLIHPSAATAKRPAGAVISSPRGWYDAGGLQ
ncbi:MAG: cellulase N-terminal Ig-like domain-containing protein [Bacteroidota bacterium]